ncbi:hypothetical protein [Anaerolentibacter hominis]|uniref:hypothetical protein n=1 Tax=Anaerolentibacter hominis TaxID=3079009 RepID=UPI0031B8AF71
MDHNLWDDLEQSWKERMHDESGGWGIRSWIIFGLNLTAIIISRWVAERYGISLTEGPGVLLACVAAAIFALLPVWPLLWCFDGSICGKCKGKGSLFAYLCCFGFLWTFCLRYYARTGRWGFHIYALIFLSSFVIGYLFFYFSYREYIKNAEGISTQKKLKRNKRIILGSLAVYLLIPFCLMLSSAWGNGNTKTWRVNRAVRGYTKSDALILNIENETDGKKTSDYYVVVSEKDELNFVFLSMDAARTKLTEGRAHYDGANYILEDGGWRVTGESETGTGMPQINIPSVKRSSTGMMRDMELKKTEEGLTLTVLERHGETVVNTCYRLGQDKRLHEFAQTTEWQGESDRNRKQARRIEVLSYKEDTAEQQLLEQIKNPHLPNDK